MSDTTNAGPGGLVLADWIPCVTGCGASIPCGETHCGPCDRAMVARCEQEAAADVAQA